MKETNCIIVWIEIYWMDSATDPPFEQLRPESDRDNETRWRRQIGWTQNHFKKSIVQRIDTKIQERLRSTERVLQMSTISLIWKPKCIERGLVWRMWGTDRGKRGVQWCTDITESVAPMTSRGKLSRGCMSLLCQCPNYSPNEGTRSLDYPHQYLNPWL